MARRIESATGTKSSKASAKATSTGSKPTSVAKVIAEYTTEQQSEIRFHMLNVKRDTCGAPLERLFEADNRPLNLSEKTCDPAFARKASKITSILRKNFHLFSSLVKDASKQRTGRSGARATLEDLDKVYEDLVKAKAAAAAAKKALAQGRHEGYDDGFAEGRARGCEKCSAKAFAEGRAKGYDEGRATGYDEGYAKGLAAGRRAAYELGCQDGKEFGKIEGFYNGLAAMSEAEDYANSVHVPGQ